MRTLSWMIAVIMLAAAGLSVAAQPPNGPPSESPSLKAIMQQLGRDMCILSDAILREDYRGMGDAARAIAEHPGLSDRELRSILQRLGPKAHHFEQADEHVHRAAMAMHQAAREHNMAQVLRQHSALMEGCMSCHRAFRERLRSPAQS
jgi:cytochrome c556